ncbi:hypothetical protein LIA77_11311 [Sarocladium implicatum]|nr:hypothetical protein LIA77_11311 [Sarocladium implicatum]
MESTSWIIARNLEELHAGLALVNRQADDCKKCPAENPPCNCSADEDCSYKIPGDCKSCTEAICIPKESDTISDGDDGGSDGPNIGAIVGGVIGGLVVVAIVAYLVWRFLVKPKRSELAQSIYYQETQGGEGVEKDAQSRMTRRSSTHTVHSIASTVLTRASNIIQIAYIPGVTNRATPTSPTVLVPPVPPIPMQHAEGARGEEGLDDQHYFVPGALRDSTYSGLSGYSDRASYATRTSYAPRSSIASTIYGKSAHVFTSAQSGMRAKPTMVSVKSFGNGSPDSTPPVPSLDVEKFAPTRPKSTASTFSVGSTFLNNASTATATPARAQVVKVGSGPQVVKVGSGLKKVDVSRSETSSSASSTTNNVAELHGDSAAPRGSNVPTIIEDSPSVDQGPFSDPLAAKSPGGGLQVVMEDEPEDNDGEDDKKAATVSVTSIQRGSSPFGDQHATKD